MKKVIIFMICMFLIPVGFSFTTIQYQGCGFSSYQTDSQEVPEQEIISINSRVQKQVHYEPCLKAVNLQRSSLFRHSSQIQKSSYVTCERIQGTQEYSCDRTDLGNDVFKNPRNKMFSFSAKFDKGFY